MSNACDERARRILKILGVEDFFEIVFCTHIIGSVPFRANPCPKEGGWLELSCKPKQSAYQFVQNYIGATKPSQMVLFEDSKRNCEGARKAGWIVFPVNQFLRTPPGLQDGQSDPSVSNQLLKYAEIKMPQVN